MEGSPIGRAKQRPRKTIDETIQQDLDLYGLSVDMVYDKTP